MLIIDVAFLLMPGKRDESDCKDLGQYAESMLHQTWTAALVCWYESKLYPDGPTDE